MNKSLADWQAEIGAWHERAFPWAKLPHVMEKLGEERREAVLAWGLGEGSVSDELADCLICVLAAMAREGINSEDALASKFERVQAKYNSEQEMPRGQKL